MDEKIILVSYLISLYVHILICIYHICTRMSLKH